MDKTRPSRGEGITEYAPVVPSRCARKCAFSQVLLVATPPFGKIRRMRISTFTTFLLTLNLGLVVVVGYLIQTRLHSPTDARNLSMAASNVVLKAARGPKVVTVVRTNEFNWRQLESEDYRTYIERLRAIGCPEPTIRDIVIADIDQLMAPRLQATVPRRPGLQFWHPEEEELWNDFDPREGLQQQRQIDFEKREVIEGLLGVDLVAERTKSLGQEDYYGRRLGFLPDKTRSQVRTLIEKYQAEELALREKAIEEGEPLTAQDHTELQRIHQERQEAIAKVLTPEEQEQFDLWLSASANTVRHAVYGMEVTKGEFLSLYKLQESFDTTWNPDAVDLTDNATREKWEQAKRELDAQIRQQLGEQRYADYTRAQDPDFRQFNLAVTRLKLPRQVATDLYEVKRVVLEQRANVETNPALTPEQKADAFKALSDETGKILKEMLGEKGFNYYTRHAQPQWLSK